MDHARPNLATPPVACKAARLSGVKNILPGVIVARDENAVAFKLANVVLEVPAHPFTETHCMVCLRP